MKSPASSKSNSKSKGRKRLKRGVKDVDDETINIRSTKSKLSFPNFLNNNLQTCF